MRGSRVLLVLGVVLVVSLIAGAYAAGREAPPLTASQAREFTVRAFTYSGLESVEVTGEPRAEQFTVTPEEPGEGEVEGQGDGGATGETIPVWVVPATVSGRPVELYVARSGGRAVNLDDALPGGGFVLNEEQFDRLEEFRFDPAGRQLSQDRQGPAVVAGLLIALATVLLVIAVVRERGRLREGDPSPEGPATGAPPAAG